MKNRIYLDFISVILRGSTKNENNKNTFRGILSTNFEKTGA